VGERERDASALQPSKAATDAAYDTCALKLLTASLDDGLDDGPGDGPGGGGHARGAYAALLVATHNRVSVRRVTSALLRAGAPRDHPRVHFAQILGMVCLDLT
jgi:hypothetical protein